MMFLTETNVWDIVRKQYSFKMKAYTGTFSTLVTVQIIAILLSLGGVGTTGMSTDTIHITMKNFSGDMIIAFTMIWSFVIALTITKKAYRNADFAFVSNRVTSNLSNLFFLMTANIVGGITAVLSGILLKVIMYYYYGIQNIFGNTMSVPPLDLLVGVIVTILYLFLFSATGYFFGMLTQLNKALIVLLLALFIGLLFLDGFGANGEIHRGLVNFFYYETSFVLFLTKVMVIVAILFSSSILLSNRMEVSR